MTTSIFDMRKDQINKIDTLSFDEFHGLICKSMPDVTRDRQMYNLCYDLMKLSWETAARQQK